MKTRLLALVLVVGGFTAQAQDLPPPPPPPLVTAPEAPLAPAGTCSEDRDCARGSTCAGFHELGNGQWARGTCQSLGGGGACTSSRDCSKGLVCAGYQDLGGGKWSQGVCMSRDARPQSAPGEPVGLRSRDAAGPERFKYSGTVPAGFHLISRPRMNLVTPGIALLAGGHALAVLGGLVSARPLGVIPIAGPVILAVQWWDSSSNGFAAIADFFVLLVCGVDLVAQVAGVVLMSLGLAAPERWLERDAARAADKPTVSFVPSAPGAALGASLVGRF